MHARPATACACALLPAAPAPPPIRSTRFPPCAAGVQLKAGRWAYHFYTRGRQSLGDYATVEEAALAYARSIAHRKGSRASRRTAMEG